MKVLSNCFSINQIDQQIIVFKDIIINLIYIHICQMNILQLNKQITPSYSSQKDH